MYRRNLVFAAACLGMLLFGIVFLSLGSVNNMLAERFHLDDNAIGTLTALLPFGILAGSVVFGPVADRFGYKWLLVFCSLLVGVGLEGLAFARSERAVQGFVFLLGLGGGVLNGATNALAADVSEGERGAKLSLLGVFFGIGALGMPGTLAVLSQHFRLETVIAGIGTLVVLPAVFCLVIAFPQAKQAPGSGFWCGAKELLTHPVFLFAGLALAIQSGMEGMSNDWMTRYFKKVTLEGQQSAEWMNLLGLMSVTGAMVATRLILSRALRRVRADWILYGSVLSTALGAVLLDVRAGYFFALGSAVLIGAGLAAAFPVVLGYMGECYPDRSGTAFSLIFFIALIGNMTINKAFGWLAQVHGVQQYSRVMLGCLAASAFFLFCIHQQIKHRKLPSKKNEQRCQAVAS